MIFFNIFIILPSIICIAIQYMPNMPKNTNSAKNLNEKTFVKLNDINYNFFLSILKNKFSHRWNIQF